MDEIDLHEAYSGHPTVFSIKLHYSGEFTKFPSRKYVKGKVKYIDLLDSDTFYVHDTDEIMEELHQVEEGECSQGDKNGTPPIETNDQKQAPHIDQKVDDDEVQTPPATIDGVQTPPFTASDYLNLEDFIDGVQFQAPIVDGVQFKHPLLSLILMDLMWMSLILMVLMLVWTKVEGILRNYLIVMIVIF
ncbi:unnamed protein product [Lactuca saligna]|uniref:PB1-like domain-containing protein n=1 Tax=Lactuca saligna TaxID=75948 RepID=A0AA36EEJ0_LACSI|nr:unnamed protein product [Lactuca saligna]